MEQYTREQHEAYVAAEQARKAKEEQERREKMEKESAQRAWLADGGSESEFQQYWPLLRDEGRAERIKNIERQAREGMRQHSRI